MAISCKTPMDVKMFTQQVYDFMTMDKIGDNYYSVVYKARNKVVNDYVIVKRIKIEFDLNAISFEVSKVISRVRELRHPNIMQIRDVIKGKHRLYFITDFIPNNLINVIYSLDDDETLDPEVVKCLMYQIINAVLYCHKSGIFHLEIKPENIFVDGLGRVKVADAGLVVLIRAFGGRPRQYRNEMSSVWYRAPEILLGATQLTSAMDMWSVGCVFAEMLIGRPLFQETSVQKQITRICNAFGMSSSSNLYCLPPKKELNIIDLTKEETSDDTMDLLKKMLEYNPKKRITFSSALKHSYFNNMRLAPGLENL